MITISYDEAYSNLMSNIILLQQHKLYPIVKPCEAWEIDDMQSLINQVEQAIIYCKQYFSKQHNKQCEQLLSILRSILMYAIMLQTI